VCVHPVAYAVCDLGEASAAAVSRTRSTSCMADAGTDKGQG
jgi:hypothetical protein